MTYHTSGTYWDLKFKTFLWLPGLTYFRKEKEHVAVPWAHSTTGKDTGKMEGQFIILWGKNAASKLGLCWSLHLLDQWYYSTNGCESCQQGEAGSL